MKSLMKNKGMTLFELLTVIAIIGILAAITVPAFNAIGRGTRLRTAAKMITDTLSQARQIAITQRQSYYVEFDNTSEAHRLRVFYLDGVSGGNPDNPDDRIAATEWLYLPEPVRFFDQAPLDRGDGVYYYSPPLWFKFKPNGGATNSETSASRSLMLFDASTYDDDPPYNDPTIFETTKTVIITVNNVTGSVKAEFK